MANGSFSHYGYLLDEVSSSEFVVGSDIDMNNFSITNVNLLSATTGVFDNVIVNNDLSVTGCISGSAGLPANLCEGAIIGKALEMPIDQPLNTTNLLNVTTINASGPPTSAPVEGALCWTKSDNNLWVYDGTAWIEINVTALTPALSAVLAVGNTTGANNLVINQQLHLPLAEATNTTNLLNVTTGAGVPTSIGVREGSLYYDSTGNDLYIFDSVSGWLTVGAAAQNLSSVLAVGNSSGANNIVMNTGQSINYDDDITILSAGVNPISIGNTNTATGPRSITIGNNNSTLGDLSINLGNNNSSNAVGGMTFGHFCTALPPDPSRNAFSWGYGSTATGNESISQGIVSSASGLQSMAQGYEAVASGQTSVAVGRDVVASGLSSLAVGHLAKANAPQSIAIGPSASVNATGDNSIAIGTNAVVNATHLLSAAILGGTTDKNQIRLGTNVHTVSVPGFVFSENQESGGIQTAVNQTIAASAPTTRIVGGSVIYNFSYNGLWTYADTANNRLNLRPNSLYLVTYNLRYAEGTNHTNDVDLTFTLTYFDGTTAISFAPDTKSYPVSGSGSIGGHSSNSQLIKTNAAVTQWAAIDLVANGSNGSLIISDFRLQVCKIN